MHRSRTACALALTVGLALSVVACEEEGPAERAGRALDEAAENVRQSFEDLTREEGTFEKAGREADEALEDAKEALTE